METEYVPVHLESLAAFLIRHHSDQLHSITLSPDPKLHYPLCIEYVFETTYYQPIFFFFFFVINLKFSLVLLVMQS